MRRPPRCPRSATAMARPRAPSSATEVTVNTPVTHAAFQKRVSTARNAKCSSPAQREMPNTGTRYWSESHSTQSAG